MRLGENRRSRNKAIIETYNHYISDIKVSNECKKFIKILRQLKFKENFLKYLLKRNYLYNGSNVIYKQEYVEPKRRTYREPCHRIALYHYGEAL